MRKGKCQNLKDIINQVTKILKQETKEHSDEKGSEFFFRGESCLHGEDKKKGKMGECFVSCVDRKTGWINNERKLYQEALRLNVISFSEDKTMVERIARMQHYQLPTRFADMSSNALVAALFACLPGYNDEHKSCADGFIRIIKVMPYKMKSFTSDIIAAIAHLPLVDAKNIHPESKDGLDYLRYEVTNERPGFSMDIGVCGRNRTKVNKEREKVERLLRKEIQHVWAVKPIFNTNRIRSQDGVFLAFGCRAEKRSLNPVFSRKNFVKKTAPSYGILQVGVVQIDGRKKESIMEELRYFGMQEEKLYPDLANVCDVIKKRVLNT